MSEEDLTLAQLTEIESLDSDVNEIADNYLDEGMDTTVAAGGVETPDEGEIPGEAVFTGTTSVI